MSPEGPPATGRTALDAGPDGPETQTVDTSMPGTPGDAPPDAETRLADLVARVSRAQQLANMGDYDWNVADDTNQWSDQLYRIYGYEPGAMNVSYETFISHIHPDDRDRILQIHRHSYTTGEPYEMVERIVRPDGEVRHLASNGEVVTDADGTPVRMLGTCVDITDRVLAEQAHAEHAMRLGESKSRQQQATEINDRVVQGLTAALYALELDQTEQAREFIGRTLEAARRMMTELAAPLTGEEAVPGDLVRSRAAALREPSED